MELSKIVWSLVTNLPVFRPLLISRCSRRFRRNLFLPGWRRLILSLEKVWLFLMQWVEKLVILSPLDIDLKCSVARIPKFYYISQSQSCTWVDHGDCSVVVCLPRPSKLHEPWRNVNGREVLSTNQQRVSAIKEQRTQQKLNELGYETVSHPPYSPDVSLTHYHFSSILKNSCERRSSPTTQLSRVVSTSLSFADL